MWLLKCKAVCEPQLRLEASQEDCQQLCPRTGVASAQAAHTLHAQLGFLSMPHQHQHCRGPGALTIGSSATRSAYSASGPARSLGRTLLTGSDLP